MKAAESLEPEALAIKQSMRADLENVLDTLTPKESGILRLRYGLDNGVQMTLKQVGKIFKVTKERVRQIEAKAIRKLQHPARSDKLLEYAMANPKGPTWSAPSILRRS